ncbi:KR domain-containing protein, partial [Streptomyces sp. HPF1205]|uniref:KR domain-containing protein n=1 Tax=Streptomyces sp. HPF1205 TaxID=2873262 RepID=UPI001CED5A7E
MVSLLPLVSAGLGSSGGVGAMVDPWLGLLRAVVGSGAGVRVWSLSRGAVSTGRADAVVDASGGLLWGLGRVAGLEFPGVWGGSVDLPGVLDERAAGRLAAVLGQGDEDQVALRGSGVFGRRLVRVDSDTDTDGNGSLWRPSGTVLVTGGTGGLGGVVARWLVRSGTEHVVLAGRRGA